MKTSRVFLVVLDACGIGAQDDAAAYGDPPNANTVANVARACGGLSLPNLAALGLAHVVPIVGTSPTAAPRAAYGVVRLASPGKDTTTGHWEIAGILLPKPFDTFPLGFPSGMIEAFLAAIGRNGYYGNTPASGTAIIEQYHDEHARTGWPIIYTSADSVFQVAADIDVVPLSTLYAWCTHARELLSATANVARVIARPFRVQDGKPVRCNEHRRDFAVAPPGMTLLDDVLSAGGQVFAIGKIHDIFLGHGITASVHTKDNHDGFEKTLSAARGLLLDDHGVPWRVDGSAPQLVFVNLVDTDAVYGHRNDPVGFGEALRAIDAFTHSLTALLRPSDLLVITADHGCDPTVSGTDHTRERVPLLVTGPHVRHGDIGVLPTLACVADIAAAALGVTAHARPDHAFSWRPSAILGDGSTD